MGLHHRASYFLQPTNSTIPPEIPTITPTFPCRVALMKNYILGMIYKILSITSFRWIQLFLV